ncbi:alpha/beta hydrolase [Streptomyces albipurpureus]|uniref:Alpha/beta hydrolase n=1 Tax=Streptomyces albipurpureus TaxID=2897419 RepID=A0ABT0UN52_9ACTN|nr:alpha/beta hydrolase [Streptomyces sp. CWNU-1]MCM2389761.1 alpha/beta hydrolase [Streptomyces sp. CWNU-1]
MTIASPSDPMPARPAHAGTPPPFDPELEPALGPLSERLPAAITPGAIPALRRTLHRMRTPDEEIRRGGAIEFEERLVSGPPGAPDVPLLLCRPSGVRGPLPLVYFTHGGGMILGDNRNLIGEMLDWVVELEIVLVSVDYRLAPEHPYPAALDDVWAGLTWTVDHADELDADPGRVVVSGPSAGGGLTAALTLLARDRGGPRLAGQLLVCPMLDERNNTPSSHQMAGLGAWDRTSNNTGWDALLGPLRGTPDIPAYASPAHAQDLSGLPPTFLDVGSAETFRDEVVAFASGVWQAGGVAELHVWPGGFHGFDALVPEATLSKAARAARLRWLQRLLNG